MIVLVWVGGTELGHRHGAATDIAITTKGFSTVYYASNDLRSNDCVVM